ncbi:LOW QUALITY PROTEIN: olfactory receptor 4D1-like [Corapipo altera]|uniref:LOW QUALITY PROTEIN: olfactory receptor 4D1-like n=1 Tax=Corapipo altera TaxID=415028 RepID=UPI000FD6A4B7|nr:LOW QUALITY PROTEIN: olfactory receptor 4D1-like [Corapipo altera]
MEPQNVTSPVMEFVLLSFNHSLKIQQFLFTVFFTVYLMTWLGNITILITVITDFHLNTPMYFFLAYLAFTDITKSSVSTPILLSGLVSQHKTVPLKECILHMFFLHFVGGAQVFLLAVIAADQYVAIHKPLQYVTIMNCEVCLGLVAGSWAGGFIHSATQIALLLPLPYCGPNTLDNFHCDVPQVLKVVCIDTYLTELLMTSNGGLILTVILVFLLLSYAAILVKIRRQVAEGKHKALSTCVAQIMAISITFIPGIFIYAPPFKTFELDKVASIFFTVLVPVLNPWRYTEMTLRNTEMIKAIRRLVSRVL